MNSDIRSIILVEGTTDEQFIQSLLKFIRPNQSVDVQHIYFDKIAGSDTNKLGFKLKSLKTDFRINPIEHVGIILDKDQDSLDDKIDGINFAFKIADIPISFTNQIDSIKFPISNHREIAFSYFFISDGSGQGNIETLLKEIVTATPIAASCLEKWTECSQQNAIRIKQSDFLKEWIKIYLRYDYCIQNKLQSHAGICSLEKSFENINKLDSVPKAWNYNATVLADLKLYLKGFL